MFTLEAILKRAKLTCPPLTAMATFKGVIGKISENSNGETEWTIENFFRYSEEDTRYESPDFYIFDLPWRLHVCPNGRTSEDSVGWISLSLLKSYEEDEDEYADSVVGACYTFGVKRVDGTVEGIVSELYWRHGRGDEEFHYPKFLERSVLQRRRSELAPFDSLTLTCALMVDEYFEPATSLETLSQNFADLFTSQRGCDATLKVMGVEFSVHKWILSARSPVFEAMFEADMKERRTGLVEIEDCDPETFGEFLMYLYSGKVEEGSENVFDLYRMADKYDTSDLKAYCCRIIMSTLTLENVLDAVMLGREFNHLGVTLKSREFFVENFESITSSTQWVEFLSQNTDVANELLKMAPRN